MAIIRLSDPPTVHMGLEWFALANSNHFWLQHKYQMIKMYFTHEFQTSQRIAEIGCGNGMFLNLLSHHFHKPIDGIDISQDALKQCERTIGQLYLYNILEKNPLLQQRYDLMFGLDILEHIEHEQPFLSAIAWHLRPGGLLLLNIPARPGLFSAYDRALGHFRRYDLNRLRAIFQRSPLQLQSHLHWGYPYLPLLYCRKFLTQLFPASDSIELGFKTNRVTNVLLTILGRLDIPSRDNLHGTSLMILAQKR